MSTTPFIGIQFRTSISKAFFDQIMKKRVELNLSTQDSKPFVDMLEKSRQDFIKMIENNYKQILTANPEVRHTKGLKGVVNSFNSYSIQVENFSETIDTYLNDVFAMTTLNDEIEVEDILSKLDKLRILIQAYQQSKDMTGVNKAKKFGDIYIKAVKIKIDERCKILLSEDIASKLADTKDELEISFDHLYHYNKTAFECENEESKKKILNEVCENILYAQLNLIKLIAFLSIYLDHGEILTDYDYKIKMIDIVTSSYWPQNKYKALRFEEKMLSDLFDEINKEMQNEVGNEGDLTLIIDESKDLLNKLFESTSKNEMLSQVKLDKDLIKKLSSNYNKLNEISEKIKLDKKLNQMKVSRDKLNQNLDLKVIKGQFDVISKDEKNSEKIKELERLEKEIKNSREKEKNTSNEVEKESIRKEISLLSKKYASLINDLGISKRNKLSDELQENLKKMEKENSTSIEEKVKKNLNELEENENLINKAQNLDKITIDGKDGKLKKIKENSLHAVKYNSNLKKLEGLDSVSRDLLDVVKSQRDSKIEKALESLSSFKDYSVAIDKQYIPPSEKELESMNKKPSKTENKKNEISVENLKSIDKIDSKIQLKEMPEGEIADTAKHLFEQTQQYSGENPIVTQCRVITVCMAKFQLDVEKRDKKALLEICSTLIITSANLKNQINSFIKEVKPDSINGKNLEKVGALVGNICEQLRILVMIRSNSFFQHNKDGEDSSWKNLLIVCLNLSQNAEQILNLGYICSLVTKIEKWRF